MARLGMKDYGSEVGLGSALLAEDASKAARALVASMDGSQLIPTREQVLLDHLPTVRYIARRIHERLPQHVDLEDLVSAGVIGLMDAYDKFDHGKRVQFKSYAQFRIRGAILDSLRTLDWSPRELRRKGRSVEEAVWIALKLERACRVQMLAEAAGGPKLVAEGDDLQKKRTRNV